MISITFNGNNFTDLKKQIEDYLFNSQSTSTEMVFSEPEEKPKPEKKSRAKKEVKEEVKEIVTVSVTKEELHNILQDVVAAKGMPVAKNILKEFGAARMSEIKEEDFDAFYARCKTESVG